MEGWLFEDRHSHQSVEHAFQRQFPRRVSGAWLNCPKRMPNCCTLLALADCLSQVNPHINLFLNFSSRGAPGTPVTHRKGRGWEGGFAGSAIIKYLILDMTKWLRFLRHLELLPRWFGQDWSNLFLQTTFSGSITILPRTKLSDLYYILSDPSPERLRDYIHTAQLSTFPKLLFLENHMKIEKLIKTGLSASGKSMTEEGFVDREIGRAHV